MIFVIKDNLNNTEILKKSLKDCINYINFASKTYIYYDFSIYRINLFEEVVVFCGDYKNVDC